MQTTCIVRWADTPRFHAKPQIICNCVCIVNTFLKAFTNKCNLIANLAGALPTFAALAVVVYQWLPTNNRQTQARKVRIGFRKVPAAYKRNGRAQRRQGRRVVGLHHQVLTGYTHPSAGLRKGLLRVSAPKHKHHRRVAYQHLREQAACERFPTLLGMTGGACIFYSQAGVEQQHALASPVLEQTVGRHLAEVGQGWVAHQFFKYVAQRGGQLLKGWGQSGWHRKGQAVRLTWAMVRVLPQDDHTHLI